jgi:hypothetical protein
LASVVTENIILLIPTLFAMMIFALVANAVVANYAKQQQTIVIESAQNKLTTTISQLYFSVNQPEIPSCVVTKTMPLPELIDGQNYIVNGNLSDNRLTLTFNFPGVLRTDNVVVNLGPEAQWDQSSVFSSTNPNSVIIIEKYFNATIGDFRIKLSFR